MIAFYFKNLKSFLKLCFFMQSVILDVADIWLFHPSHSGSVTEGDGVSN